MMFRDTVSVMRCAPQALVTGGEWSGRSPQWWNDIGRGVVDDPSAHAPLGSIASCGAGAHQVARRPLPQGVCGAITGADSSFSCAFRDSG